MPVIKEQQPPALSELLARIADGLGTLVSEHFALARLELTEEAKAWGGALAKAAVFVPFVLLGYAFLCAALAAALARPLGLSWALFAVGMGNAVLGGIGLLVALGRLKQREPLEATVEELRQSASALVQAGAPAVAVPAVAVEVAHGR